MPAFPHDQFDSTLAFMSEGYNFISNRCKRHQSDAFTSRLMLKRVTCAMGEDAARMFYQPDRFTRKKAMLPNALMLLQDFGSVQLKDGENHRQRKHMFMSLLDADNIQQLLDNIIYEWERLISDWEDVDEITLHEQVREVLCRASCEWVGIPLSDAEAKQRTGEFGAMIDGAGSVGVRNWRGLRLRSRTERWARDIISQLREHKRELADESPLATIAWHREQNGELLDTKSVAVELLNLIRPTVAVSRYIVFAALALHEHPECWQRIQMSDGEYIQWFVQEVRRFYPFFPCAGGRVLEPFDWHDHQFGKGDWVLLDLYGTNHDNRIWNQPDVFRPERFRDWNGSPFNFIPQGGGEVHNTHRCPGEQLTIEVTKTAVQLLVSAMSYQVPAQSLDIDLSKMPAMPESRFVIRDVRRLSPSHHA